MKLFRYKPLDLGFVVLCVDRNLAALRVTASSIRNRYNVGCVAAVGEDATPEEVEAMSKICPVYRGKDTVTSLINAGMDHAPADWNMLVMSGVWVRKNLDKKYSYFVESECDVLYAIVDGHYEFTECSLNGLMVHKTMWEKAGRMCPKSSLPICKLLWAQEAIAKGGKLKAIIGAKMF